MTESKIRELLRAKYQGDGWIFAEEVANDTGANARWRADGIAMGIWPSRGYEIHGFEIKVSRSDWLKELNSPGKSDEIISHTDYWWVVAPADIVKPAELIGGWGLLIASEKGLRVGTRPTKRETILKRGFVAAMLRRCFESEEKKIKSRLREATDAGWRKGREEGLRHNHGAQDAMELSELRQVARAFEQASGLKYTTKTAGEIAESVARYMRAEAFWESYEFSRLRGLKTEAVQVAERIGAMIDQITKSEEDHESRGRESGTPAHHAGRI